MNSKIPTIVSHEKKPSRSKLDRSPRQRPCRRCGVCRSRPRILEQVRAEAGPKARARKGGRTPDRQVRRVQEDSVWVISDRGPSGKGAPGARVPGYSHSCTGCEGKITTENDNAGLLELIHCAHEELGRNRGNMHRLRKCSRRRAQICAALSTRAPLFRSAARCASICSSAHQRGPRRERYETVLEERMENLKWRRS